MGVSWWPVQLLVPIGHITVTHRAHQKTDLQSASLEILSQQSWCRVLTCAVWTLSKRQGWESLKLMILVLCIWHFQNFSQHLLAGEQWQDLAMTLVPHQTWEGFWGPNTWKNNLDHTLSLWDPEMGHPDSKTQGPSHLTIVTLEILSFLTKLSPYI